MCSAAGCECVREYMSNNDNDNITTLILDVFPVPSLSIPFPNTEKLSRSLRRLLFLWRDGAINNAGTFVADC